MPDLAYLLEMVRENPGDESRWLDLSRWLAGNGQHDEAAAVRVFWPSLRDAVMDAGVPLDEALAGVSRNAGVMGERARQFESRDEKAN